MSVEYSAVSAKLKGMYGRALTMKDYEEMLSRHTVGEICAYLKQNTGYSDVLSDYNENSAHRGELEVRLRYSLFDEFERLCTFMNQRQRKFLRLWDMQWEIDVIKQALRYIFNKEVNDGSWLDGSFITDDLIKKRTVLDYDGLRNVKTLSDLAAVCSGTPYERVLSVSDSLSADLFSIGMKLDGLYFETLWHGRKSLDREDKEAFSMWLGSCVDMLNIMWIYRGKKYWHFRNEMIYTYLAPVRYRLSAEDISYLVQSETTEQFVSYVRSDTVYGALFDNEDEGIFVEENYGYLAAKKSRYIMSAHPLTMAAVFAYINLKELEISNITIIIEGIRYGINSDNIRKHIKLGGI